MLSAFCIIKYSTGISSSVCTRQDKIRGEQNNRSLFTEILQEDSNYSL
jgi:hypothetical protein